MNKRILFLLGALLCTWGLPGTGISGYRDMCREFDAYQAPVPSAPEPATRAFSARPEENTAFQQARRRVQEVQERWEKTLSVRAPHPSFYRPDPALLASLEATKSDPAEAGRLLRDTLSLESLKALTLIRYPGVRSAEHRFRAALEQFRQVTALDEILRRYTAFTEGVMTGVGPMKGKDPVRLKFPFPGVLALKAEIVSKGAEAARESLEAARRDAVVSATRAFWDLAYNLRAQEIVKETLGLYRHLHRVALIRYESGRTNFQDLIKVRIQRDVLADHLVTLARAQGNMEMKIREFVDLPPEVPVGSPDPPALITTCPGLPDLYKMALEHNQEIRRLRAEVGKMERMVQLAETMILPSLSLNLSIYEDEAFTQVGPGARKETFPVSVKASQGAGLPRLPFLGTQDAYLRETRSRVTALRNELTRKERATLARVRQAWFRLDRSLREVRLYREKVTEPSRDALDVSTQGYRAGNVGFADVIASYDLWLRAHLTLEKNRTEVGKALAALEQVVGTALDR